MSLVFRTNQKLTKLGGKRGKVRENRGGEIILNSCETAYLKGLWASVF